MTNRSNDSGQAWQPDLLRHWNMMCGWARRAGVAVDDASDIVQEAMVKAVNHESDLAKLDERRRLAWLKTTIRRTAMDADRHRKRARRGGGNLRSLDDLGRDSGPGNRHSAPTEPIADDTSPSKRAEITELRNQLLDNLPDEDRRVCALILKDKCSPEQVAEELGISSEDVFLRAGAGMLRLRQMLKQLLKSEGI